MGLITTLHLLGRESELHIYAYHQLEEIIDLHLSSSQTVLRYPLIFHPIDPEKHEVILDTKVLYVKTIPMKHGIPTCGFLIQEKESNPNIKKEFLEGKKLDHSVYDRIKNGEDYIDADGRIYKHEEITSPPKEPRSYAYCTDTAYDESLLPMIKNVSLLYHEATFMDDRKADAEAKFHSTASQAATIAKKAGAGKLLIGHYSARYKDLDGLLKEAQAIFPDTAVAEEGNTISL